MDQDHVRPNLLQHRSDPLQDVHGDVKQSLLILHDGEIIIRLHPEGPQHLVQHLPVLTGHADHRFKLFRSALQFQHQRAHFGGLRPGAENQHDFFHRLFSPALPPVFRACMPLYFFSAAVSIFVYYSMGLEKAQYKYIFRHYMLCICPVFWKSEPREDRRTEEERPRGDPRGLLILLLYLRKRPYFAVALTPLASYPLQALPT